MPVLYLKVTALGAGPTSHEYSLYFAQGFDHKLQHPLRLQICGCDKTIIGGYGYRSTDGILSSLFPFPQKR